VSLFSFNLQAFGLDISDYSFKLAAVEKGAKDRYQLKSWNKIAVPAGVIEHGLIKDADKVIAYLRQLRDEAKGERLGDFAVVSLPETRTFLKLLQMDKTEASDPDKLSELVEAELPKEIPLPKENIHYDYVPVGSTEDHLLVLVGAIERDVVNEYTEVLKEAGIKPLAMEVEAQAIVRALLPPAERTCHTKVLSAKPKPASKLGQFFRMKLGPGHEQSKKEDIELDHSEEGQAVKPRSKKSKTKAALESVDQVSGQSSANVCGPPRLIVDLGATRTGLITHHEGIISLTRSLERSGSQITQAIAEKLSLTPAKAEQAKMVCGFDPKKCKGQIVPLIRGWVEGLSSEIQETIEYFEAENPRTDHFREIILCGGGAALSQLNKRLEQAIGLPVVVADPLNQVDNMKDEDLRIPARALPSMTTVMGLAMREE